MPGGKRVIIIEDDVDISNFIAYNLIKEGFVVEQVFDGLSARQRIKEEVFSIVILDIMLPGLDGFAICKEIRDDPGYFRSFIVVVSAKGHQEDKLYAYILGADYYLAKPFNLMRLLSVVREVSGNFSREFLVKSKCTYLEAARKEDNQG